MFYAEYLWFLATWMVASILLFHIDLQDLQKCDFHMQPWSNPKVTQENGNKRWNKIRFGWKMKLILLFMTHFISFHIPIHIFSQSYACEKMWILMKNRHNRFLWSHFTNAFHAPFHNAACTQKMEKLHFTTLS